MRGRGHGACWVSLIMASSLPLVRARWGSPRSASHVLRVSPEVHDVLQRLTDRDRRRWVDVVILDAFRARRFDPVFKDSVEKTKRP